MLSWEECPEAAGPQVESESGNLFGIDYGQPGQISIGRPPRQMSLEQMEKERAQAAAIYERRQRVEAAALSISVSVMEGKTLTEKILSEAAAAADKAVTA